MQVISRWVLKSSIYQDSSLFHTLSFQNGPTKPIIYCIYFSQLAKCMVDNMVYAFQKNRKIKDCPLALNFFIWLLCCEDNSNFTYLKAGEIVLTVLTFLIQCKGKHIRKQGPDCTEFGVNLYTH